MLESLVRILLVIGCKLNSKVEQSKSSEHIVRGAESRGLLEHGDIGRDTEEK